MREGVQGAARWTGRFVILASWVVPASVIVVTLVTATTA
jgi:hypothetical protein